VANALEQAVRALCLAFPHSEMVISHGAPNFRVRGGRIFATYAVNHHGDGRIALWLNVPAGVQESYVRAEPEHFFVPAYVGPSGWLGVRLDRKLPWRRIAELVRLAFVRVAPGALANTPAPKVPAPRVRVTLADVDPKQTARGRKVLAAMRRACAGLPGVTEATQFGQPVWRAGKKVFAQAYCYAEEGWRAAFWVGIGRQGLMTADERFSIPAYMGHLGWIALDVSRRHDARELRSLAVESYRHFALKRMLAQLASDAGPD